MKDDLVSGGLGMTGEVGRIWRGLCLSRDRKAALLRAMALLLVAEQATRRLALARVLGLGSRARLPWRQLFARNYSPHAEVAMAVWAVERASTLLRLPNCLTRAVGLRMLLARRGVASELHLGVRKADNGRSEGIAGHAWLTVDGRTVVGGNEQATSYVEIRQREHQPHGALRTDMRSAPDEETSRTEDAAMLGGAGEPAQSSGGLAETVTCQNGSMSGSGRGLHLHARQTQFKASDFLSNSKADEVVQ